MDILISAAQGHGKTLTALHLIKEYLQARSFNDIVNDVHIITQAQHVGDNASRLAQRLREAKPRAILFDGDALETPAHLTTAVDAVKRYRDQTGRPDTIAVYIEQRPRVAIVLADKYKAASGVPLAESVTPEDVIYDPNPLLLALPYRDQLARVIDELVRQDQRFGPDRDQSLITWLGVLNEEVLEVTRAIVNFTTADTATPFNVLRNDLRAELTQVAAVAIQILKSYKELQTPTNQFKDNEN